MVHDFNYGLQQFVQELDWYCGLVICNYAVGGNLANDEMYQVTSSDGGSTA